MALEVARLVAQVHGFDRSASRIEHAMALAEKRSIPNATFEVASIEDVRLEPESWDVTLFLAVWGKRTLAGRRAVGARELARLLQATRRQLIARVGLQKDERREANLLEILDVCDTSGFDALGFNRPLHEGRSLRGNLLVANRRGAGARPGELPPVALVPTARLTEHPIVVHAHGIRAPGTE